MNNTSQLEITNKTIDLDLFDLQLIDLESIGETELNDKSKFGKIFSRTVEVFGLKDEDLASMFKVSLPTIERWKQGEAAPHSLGRSSVFQTLWNFGFNKRMALKNKI